jgi:hypothetical protein
MHITRMVAGGAAGGGGPVDPGPAWIDYDERQLDGATLDVDVQPNQWRTRKNLSDVPTSGSFDVVVGAPVNDSVTWDFDITEAEAQTLMESICGAGNVTVGGSGFPSGEWKDHAGMSSSAFTIQFIGDLLGTDLDLSVTNDTLDVGTAEVIEEYPYSSTTTMTVYPNQGSAGSAGDAVLDGDESLTGFVVYPPPESAPASESGIVGATLLVDDVAVGPGWVADEEIVAARLKLQLVDRAADTPTTYIEVVSVQQLASAYVSTGLYAEFDIEAHQTGDLLLSCLDGTVVPEGTRFEDLVVDAYDGEGSYEACMLSGAPIPRWVVNEFGLSYFNSDNPTTEVGPGAVGNTQVVAVYSYGGLVMPLDPGEEWTIQYLWVVGTDGYLDGEEWCPLTADPDDASNYSDCYVFDGDRASSYLYDIESQYGGPQPGDVVIRTIRLSPDGCITHVDGYEVTDGDQTQYGFTALQQAASGVMLANYPGGGYCAPGNWKRVRVWQKALTEDERRFTRLECKAQAEADGLVCTLYDETPEV